MTWADELFEKSKIEIGITFFDDKIPKCISVKDLKSAVLKINEEIIGLTTHDGFQDFNKRYQLWARAFTELVKKCEETK